MITISPKKGDFSPTAKILAPTEDTMKLQCAGCDEYFEDEDLRPVGPYLACPECWIRSQLPLYLKIAEGK